MILAIHPANPEPRLVARVVAILERGGVVAYPTDTVYALGCDAQNNRAVERLYRTKRDARAKPFSLVCRDFSELALYARVSDYAYRVLRHHLPGPYVFILEASRMAPKLLTSRRKAIGVRIPANPVAQELVRGLGRPILSTSLRDAGGEMVSDAAVADALVGKGIDLVVDGGDVGKVPSSVVSLVDDQPAIIRSAKGDLSYFAQ